MLPPLRQFLHRTLGAGTSKVERAPPASLSFLAVSPSDAPPEYVEDQPPEDAAIATTVTCESFVAASENGVVVSREAGASWVCAIEGTSVSLE